MTLISRYFLDSRAWQVFVYLTVVQYVVPLVIEEGSFDSTGLPEPSNLKALAALGVACAVQGILFLAWYWFVGTFLFNVADVGRPHDQLLFRCASAYFAFYGLIAPYLFAIRSHEWTLLLPLHLLALGCIFYVFKVVARLITFVQTREWKPFREYVGTFLLLFFIPIGIWFLQPKINAIYAKYGDRR